MKLIDTNFLYEDKNIAVCEARYSGDNGEVIVHIDVGYKDEDGDILTYQTLIEKIQ